MTNLFHPVCQYEPKDNAQAFLESEFCAFLNHFKISYVIRAEDEVCVVAGKDGKFVEVEPWMYLYVRKDGTLYTDWQ